MTEHVVKVDGEIGLCPLCEKPTLETWTLIHGPCQFSSWGSWFCWEILVFLCECGSCGAQFERSDLTGLP